MPDDKTPVLEFNFSLPDGPMAAVYKAAREFNSEPLDRAGYFCEVALKNFFRDPPLITIDDLMWHLNTTAELFHQVTGTPMDSPLSAEFFIEMRDQAIKQSKTIIPASSVKH